ncbi:hypothetical protein J8M97_20265 [Gordonia polyisoprenivorans]|uniref:hypothetical protein n=1 Tax=Gordonia polyisoprenivorans TaxID=84595 RepID=UPI001B8B4A03|nr:hypothetical protein [Gordonia polyisoprenivorans]QUD82049.1 hypothetical protein J8M97_20265 [Gordonia polyisoprenivorans]
MGQLAFFSAETDEPAIDDLAGLLAGPGQSAPVYAGADPIGTRVSVIVAERWRADAIVAQVRTVGLDAEVITSDEGNPLARTAPSPRLDELHRRWSTGAVKTMPTAWVPTPHALRFWVLAAGRTDPTGQYVLGLDAHCPDSHPVLATALMRVGIAPTLVGNRIGAPALRVGRRRLARLAEYVGPPPPGATAREWPGAG